MNKKRTQDQSKYDRIYVDWRSAPSIRTLTAVPLKSIYINRAADLYALDYVVKSVERLEDLAERYGITDFL